MVEADFKGGGWCSSRIYVEISGITYGGGPIEPKNFVDELYLTKREEEVDPS